MSASRGTLPFALRVLVAGLIVGLLLTPAAAQVTTGSISGTVSDSTGAIVTGADVTVRNVGTNASRTVKTNSVGLYLVPDLPVGQYEITVQMTGFATLKKTGISLTVGAANVQNITLAVGAATEVVQVQADLAQVETASSHLGALVDQRQMRDLPLNGRNFEQLILLAPGVQPITTGNQAAMYGRAASYSTAGARPEGEAILLDGTDIGNFWGHGTGASMVGTSLGVEAIGEFQTLTNTYSAEFGGAGSAINAVSKSGTNSLHGSAYEFIRNSALDARNYFDGRDVAPFRRNQFGASLGGPIKKDSTFFFVNYEGLRQQLGVTYTGTVPDDAIRTSATDPNIIKLLELYPHANGPVNSATHTGAYTSTGNMPANEDYFLARVDQQLGSKDSLFGRFVRDAGDLFDSYPNQARGGLIPGWPETDNTHNYYLTAEEKHIATANMINLVRLSLVRTDQGTSVPPDNSVLQIFQGVPASSLTVTGLSGIGPQGNNPFKYVQYKYTWEDQVYWTRGSHDLRFGGSIQRQMTDANMGLYKGGSWSFGSVANLVANKPTQFQGPNVPVSPDAANARRIFREYDFAAYIQDNWKVRPNLSLNLGVRYQPLTNPTPVDGTVLNAIVHPLTGTGYEPMEKAFLDNPSLKNIDPRIGLAYTPFGNQKTVIRAGFGMFHMPIQAHTYGGSYFTAKPYLLSLQTAPLTFPNAFQGTVSTPKPSTIVAMDVATDQTPYYMQWNLNLQEQISSGLIATVAYVGSRGNHLMAARDLNPVNAIVQPDGSYYFPNTTRLNSNFSSLFMNVAAASSNYNSLQLSLKGQATKSLQVQLYYTWAHSLSNADNSTSSQTTNGSSTQINPYDISYDYGSSSYDIRQNFTGNLLYELPFKGNAWVSGYQISLISSLHSGPPYSANVGYDAGRVGGTGTATTVGERPNLVGDPNVAGPVAANPLCVAPAKVHTAATWFNPCAFMIPGVQPNGPLVTGLLGNLGRNSLIGPATINFDLALSKSTSIPKISDRFKVQFRAEMFNLFNHTNLALPNSFAAYSSSSFLTSTGTVASNMGQVATIKPPTTAGQIVRTTTTSRQMQFGLKFLW